MLRTNLHNEARLIYKRMYHNRKFGKKIKSHLNVPYWRGAAAVDVHETQEADDLQRFGRKQPDIIKGWLNCTRLSAVAINMVLLRLCNLNSIVIVQNIHELKQPILSE